ncbi:phosphoribosylformylglycinamidine synthase [uncultured Fibrobacter sp.]|uniref:phosphoribosylformylglycinamidine synthase n=1 Tax=uncultured Fibrobacter sp. TaxID=261512 RepID=UPI0026077212|nr:phosphoribosylformylglycinamidine synthase [uncultured Fibrobacter sp.]
MILLIGGDAYSPFRLESLKNAMIKAGICKKLSIEAKWVYAMELAGEKIDPNDLKRATELLNADGTCPKLRENEVFVFPRKGTISPWSSKATDIFRNCALKSVKRVERGVKYSFSLPVSGEALDALYDKMTEGVYNDVSDLFNIDEPRPGRSFDVLAKGVEAIREANDEMGLAISEKEMNYLAESFIKAGRNPTDTELTMFGQVNSEHCRHKIFGAEFVIDGKKKKHSLFEMIKNTHKKRPQDTLSAYKDNSSVVAGFKTDVFAINPENNVYSFKKDSLDQLMKVETHNHPTAISPYPGAATGVGGEIRDESATGRGSRTVAGICGFMVSNLRIPGFPQPWERVYADFPRRLATPLQIMTEGPIGGAAFGNEFGRPQLCGFFRTYEGEVAGELRGYHKPIMLAGGMGTIRRSQVKKADVEVGALIVQIGGPAMRIGLGGGAASSMMTGTNSEALDFNSVQRGNAEMQRRCQGVIDACSYLGKANPIVSIHDIGAGGLSNGCPELVEATGGKFELRKIHNEEPSMNPMEIWCCESQERYVLALKPSAKHFFEQLCARERCPVAFIGIATGDGQLVLDDSHFGDSPIDMDIKVLLGKPPRMKREVSRVKKTFEKANFEGVKPLDAFTRVLHLPAVADKTFLISIGDRSVTGMICRDQMVGPWQVPVADCAVTSATLDTYEGEVMSMGERAPVALISPAAAARMTVAESLTNMAAACVPDMGRVNLSANWMATPNYEGDGADLYEAVKSIGMELCPELGITIPVGKDSMSMSTVWSDAQGSHRVTAPISLVISAFAPCADVRKTLTPQLLQDKDSTLVLVDLARGKNRMGASIAAQVYNNLGDKAPDVDSAKELRAFFETIQKLNAAGKIMAYHDKSDGGLYTTLAEMAFAGHVGVTVKADALKGNLIDTLFNEELGAVLQVKNADLAAVRDAFAAAGLGDTVSEIGTLNDSYNLVIGDYAEGLSDLRAIWSDTTRRIAALRDNPDCAESEYKLKLEQDNPGITPKVPFDVAASAKIIKDYASRPKMAILREQGVNGELEMAAAFQKAGFESIDVHMTDILEGRVSLKDFNGLVACGGFSYGDVLGAGEGWAKSILFNPKARAEFEAYFNRKDTFTLGVCNGCQMVSNLKDLIPGAKHWPRFVQNLSERFEARFCTLKVEDTPAVLLKGMAGSVLPIAVAHGEGRAEFASREAAEACLKTGLVALRYVDGKHEYTERYPLNPNGSPFGINGLCSEDGRALVMMPHPERVFRTCQYSWHPAEWGEDGPWMQLFRNGRIFVG